MLVVLLTAAAVRLGPEVLAAADGFVGTPTTRSAPVPPPAPTTTGAPAPPVAAGDAGDAEGAGAATVVPTPGGGTDPSAGTTPGTAPGTTPGTRDPLPDVTGLDPVLADRLTAAVALAAAEGVELRLTSGWRSAQEQAELVGRAVAELGEAEARRRVLPPERSAHVAGTAVDVGPREGAAWLEAHPGTGLCRTYANEWWHFEPARPDGSCPPPLPDSSGGWD